MVLALGVPPTAGRPELQGTYWFGVSCDIKGTNWPNHATLLSESPFPSGTLSSCPLEGAVVGSSPGNVLLLGRSASAARFSSYEIGVARLVIKANAPPADCKQGNAVNAWENGIVETRDS